MYNTNLSSIKYGEEFIKMKKSIFCLSMILFVFLFAHSTFANETSITETPTLKVIVDGTQLDLKNAPVNYNSRALLGLRELLIALGVPNDSAHITWNPDDKSIKILKDSTEIFLSIGNNIVNVNGEEIELDVAPIIYKDSTYIPVRFISQSLSRFVYWDSKSYSVIITKEESYNQISELLRKIDAPKVKPIQIKQNEVITVEGIEKYKCNYDIKKDVAKNITHINLFETSDGITTETEIYQDADNIYKKSQIRRQWGKQARALNNEHLSENEIDESISGSLAASLIIKEKDNNHIILEGDNLILVADSANDSITNVLKDKTSKCHIKYELKVTTIDLGITKYEIERIDCVTTGSYESTEGAKNYTITEVTEYMLDTDITVSVPSDLDNYYTIPEGTREYYNSYGGYSLFVPNSWNLPSSDEKTPAIVYENAEDPNKYCGILVEFINLNFSCTLSDIQSDLVKIAQDPLTNSNIIKNEKIKWNGDDAILITVTGNIKNSDNFIKKQLICSMLDGRLTIVTYIGDPTTYELKYDEATKIINSWTQLVFG